MEQEYERINLWAEPEKPKDLGLCKLESAVLTQELLNDCYVLLTSPIDWSTITTTTLYLSEE